MNFQKIKIHVLFPKIHRTGSGKFEIPFESK